MFIYAALFGIRIDFCSESFLRPQKYATYLRISHVVFLFREFVFSIGVIVVASLLMLMLSLVRLLALICMFVCVLCLCVDTFVACIVFHFGILFCCCFDVLRLVTYHPDPLHPGLANTHVLASTGSHNWTRSPSGASRSSSPQKWRLRSGRYTGVRGARTPASLSMVMRSWMASWMCSRCAAGSALAAGSSSAPHVSTFHL